MKQAYLSPTTSTLKATPGDLMDALAVSNETPQSPGDARAKEGIGLDDDPDNGVWDD